MDAGPGVEDGSDVALTELPPVGEATAHELLARAGSERGAELLARLPRREATARDRERGRAVVEATTASLGRALDTEGIRELLYDAAEHPRWDDVASRCLACTNCTLVCPTCFCSSVSDTSDLTGAHVTRARQWDSCFSLEFSTLAGGSARASTRSRYRQWMTHKLASWIDQFGSSGCVGCGRCITWCPVGIDITQEVAAIRAAPMGARRGEPAGGGAP
jgi:ferredoxin